jgi:hypothetical protein
MQVLNWLQVNIAEELKIVVANRTVPFKSEGDGNPSLIAEAVVSARRKRRRAHCVFSSKRLACGVHFFETGSESGPALGVCVGWVEIEPLA